MIPSNIILASASPRRLEIFNNHGLEPVVIPSDAEEHIPMALSPEETTMFLSLQKGLSVRRTLAEGLTQPDLKSDLKQNLIVAADTIVVIDGEILGKPTDKADATRMIKKLSGRAHQVITGVTVLEDDRGTVLVSPSAKFCKKVTREPSPCHLVCFYDVTDVYFVDIPEADIEAYVETEEPYDKAGAYAVQGTFAKYTKRVDGDLENVIGFPFSKFETIVNSFF